MKNSLQASFAIGVTIASLTSMHANAQTVQVKGIGSSALLLELGLGASSTTGAIKATCVWSENTNSVIATDSSAGVSVQDKGSAWVAWTPGSGGTCAVPVSPQVYAYLQTDSVVGTRCLFDGARCTISYPTTNPDPANLILSVGESPLPISIATALNNASVNAAGTNIRPEDAEFATVRALAPCGAPVTAGSQYLGLGYANGSAIESQFGGSAINLVDFSLPTSFTVIPVGATPVLVVVNNNPTFTNLSSQALANFLDGIYSYTNQALTSP